MQALVSWHKTTLVRILAIGASSITPATAEQCRHRHIQQQYIYRHTHTRIYICIYILCKYISNVIVQYPMFLCQLNQYSSLCTHWDFFHYFISIIILFSHCLIVRIRYIAGFKLILTCSNLHLYLCPNFLYHSLLHSRKLREFH